MNHQSKIFKLILGIHLMAQKFEKHDCEFPGDKHLAIFKVNFYEGVAVPGEEDTRGSIHATKYSCQDHLSSVIKEAEVSEGMEFRQDEETGDTIVNLRNGKEYSNTEGALRGINSFSAYIEICDPNPISRLQGIQQKMRDYLGSPGEIKKVGDKTALQVGGRLESITDLILDELKNMEDISFSMHVDRKDLKYK